MKKLLLLIVFTLSSMAHSAEMTVLESRLTNVQTYNQTVHTRFQIDQSTGQGYAEVTVVENRYTWDHHYPGPGWGNGRHPMPQSVPTVIYQNKVAIEGLILVNDKLIYQDETGDVDCGTLGVSRIFKRPTIYLTGSCKFKGRVDRRNNLRVTLVTK